MNTSRRSIAELAYELWKARGCPNGSSEQDWLEAERLAAHSAAAEPSRSESEDEASIESFPASDPPASHIPDVPPSNAGEKWTAPTKQKSQSRS
jgi:hypothetical protein